jgi:hypothetical protein
MLQLGYKARKTAFSDSDGEEVKGAEPLEDSKWSHLDLNQGPPACEEDQEPIHPRPLTSYVADFTRKKPRSGFR